MSVACGCLGREPVPKVAATIQLEDVSIVATQVGPSESPERSHVLELLLQEVLAAGHAVHRLGLAVRQEHEYAAVELRERHVEDLVVLGLAVDLVALVDLPQVVLRLLVALA